MVARREVATEAHVASIRAIETKADGVVRQIFLSANRTFYAPIDREDILMLAHDLDDVVDLIEDTAKGIQRYSLSTFPVEMQTMVNAVVESAALLKKAIPFLDSITRDHRQIFAICERIGQLEEQADDAFDAALARIRTWLGTGTLDAIGYLDRKELLGVPVSTTHTITGAIIGVVAWVVTLPAAALISAAVYAVASRLG